MCCTLDVRLSSEARAFLRTVRNSGGSLHIEQDWQILLAKECAANALLGFAGGGSRVEMTGRGYDYLNRLMRAH